MEKDLGIVLDMLYFIHVLDKIFSLVGLLNSAHSKNLFVKKTISLKVTGIDFHHTQKYFIQRLFSR